jgi:hypothetical protein
MNTARLKWTLIPALLYLGATVAIIRALPSTTVPIWIQIPAVLFTLPGFACAMLIRINEQALLVACPLFSAAFIATVGWIAGKQSSGRRSWQVFLGLQTAGLLVSVVILSLMPNGGRGLFNLAAMRAERVLKLYLAGSDAQFEKAYSQLPPYGRADVVNGCLQKCEAGRAEILLKRYLSEEGTTPPAGLVIASMESERLIPHLEHLLTSPNDPTRAQAACQLAKITGKLYRYEETNQTKMFEKLCDPIKRIKKGA